MIDRFKDMSSRAKVFALLAVVLLILGLTGILTASSDVKIDRADAIESARAYADFEVVDAEARLIRQGFGLKPVWAVSLSIPMEGNPREYVRLTTVEVDARTGEVTRIAIVRDGTSGEDGDPG